mmetsp:Transcript_18090/g.56954  ORF Transcript_18090/g.56954 Transcript_18090/m.56954 type:complete len:355 (+) Transcript_18090:127-1191(+)
MPPPSRVPAAVADGRFEITRRLGSGCFGVVYRGVDSQTHVEVAVKFEAVDSKAPQLQHEASVLSQLQSPVEPQGIAEYFYFGKEAGLYCLVMEALGMSLEDQVRANGGQLSLRSTVLVADQALRRLEFLHSRCIVHRDVKPENFMFGVRERRHHLYLIDFGLSKRYFTQRRHASIRQTASLTGTARYVSINAHRGVELSRRDDLEAVGHMLIYLLRGSLPWSGLAARGKQDKYRKIKQAKEATLLSDLCKGFPEEFETYLACCRNLLFAERPNYQMLRGLFTAVRERLGMERGRPVRDQDFEWIDRKDGRNSEALVPLSPHPHLLQPEDRRRPAGRRSRWGPFLFCGRKVAAID